MEHMKKESILHLAYVESVIKQNVESGFRDANMTMQRFMCGLLNIVYDLNLKELDEGNKFQAAIDLGDKSKKISYQITSSNERKKILSTIDTFERHKLYKEYNQLNILILGKKKNYSKPIESAKIEFSIKKNIIDIRDLESCINKIDNFEKVKEIKEYLDRNTRYLDSKKSSDRELVEFFISCFDREAFKRTIYVETSIEDMQVAIEDTLIALNSGILKDRNGRVIKERKGKSSVENMLWRSKLDKLGKLLSDLNNKIDEIEDYEKFTQENGEVFYNFSSNVIPQYINEKRNQCIDIINELAGDLKLNKFSRIQ